MTTKIGPGRAFPGIHLLPDSINAIVGNLNGGTVDDIQVWQDGNVLDTWKILLTFETGMGLNYRYCDFPVEKPIDRFNFIDPAGNVKIRLYHPEGGNAAHNTFVDYIALIR